MTTGRAAPRHVPPRKVVIPPAAVGALVCHAIAAGSVPGAATVHRDAIANSDRPAGDDEASVIRITTNLPSRSTHQLCLRKD